MKKQIIDPLPEGTPQINVETFLKMAQQGEMAVAAAAAKGKNLDGTVLPQVPLPPVQAAPQQTMPLPLQPFLDKLDVIIVSLKALNQNVEHVATHLAHEGQGIVFCLKELQKLNARFES